MRQYVVDDLRYSDYEKLKSILDNTYGNSGVDGIYWIEIAADVLTPVQASHNDCKPYYFAVELDEDKISAEFLVRSRNNMRCPCMGLATGTQLNWIINFVELLLSETGIIN